MVTIVLIELGNGFDEVETEGLVHGEVVLEIDVEAHFYFVRAF